MRPIHTLVIHCTATPEGKEFTLGQIDAMHRARNFKKIGYHLLIHLDGSVSRGRADDEIGAHVAGHNTGTLGYSYVGGVERDGKTPKDTRTPAQKETLTRLVKEAIEKYRLKAVLGHRDLSPDLDGDGEIEPYEWIKVCPCFEAILEYAPLLEGAPKPSPGADHAAAGMHVVVAGESLWAISRKYGFAGPAEIIAANPQIKNPADIQPGQEITIPRPVGE